MPSPQTQAPPSPERIYDLMGAFRRSAALKTAIELNVFTHVAAGAATAGEIGKAIPAPERGVRILCDFLAINGLLLKQGERYSLAPDAAFFLDQRSPAYLGGVAEFLVGTDQLRVMESLTAAVRHGGAPSAPPVANYPEWITFARAMGPFMGMQAEMLAQQFGPAHGKILDVAASHGLYGIAFARHSPDCEVYALDAAPVLDVVARENAAQAGVTARYHAMPGDAFSTPLGEGYSLILVTNFLHHFAPAQVVEFLRRLRPALKPGGRVLTLDFVPNPDRISPPAAASFALTMLAFTAAGDAYTFAEYEAMFREAGFARLEAHPLPTPQTVLLATL